LKKGSHDAGPFSLLKHAADESGRVQRMSSKIYESIGRAVVWGAKRKLRQSARSSSIRYGAIGAVAIGVIAVGAVLARSHAPAE
jgi:hypothetical protein